MFVSKYIASLERRDDDYTRQTQSMCSCCETELNYYKEITLVFFFFRKINNFIVQLHCNFLAIVEDVIAKKICNKMYICTPPCGNN